MRVLVADPCAERRERLSSFLDHLGCRVVGASSGSSTLRSALGKDRPELLFLATGFDDCDGVRVCAELRRRHVSSSQPQVVLVGPSGGEPMLGSALEAGVNDWLGGVEPKAALAHLRFARLVQERQVSCVGVLREQLAALGEHDTGTICVATRELTARVQVCRGRLAAIGLGESEDPFVSKLRLYAERSARDISSWKALRGGGGPPTDWQQTLVMSGFWEQARTRIALQSQWDHRLRGILSMRNPEIRFESYGEDWPEEFTFAFREFWPDIEAADLPRCYQRRLPFLQHAPDNDIVQSRVL